MTYSKEAEDYIDYVAGKLKKGGSFQKGAVENFAIEKGIPVGDVAREIIRRTGAPVTPTTRRAIASLERLALFHDIQLLPEHLGKRRKTIDAIAGARQKGLKGITEALSAWIKQRGYESPTAYQNALTEKRGFKSRTEYQNFLSSEKGFKSQGEYRNAQARGRGYKNATEYGNAKAQERGYKGQSDYVKALAINKIVPLARTLLEAGLDEKQVRTILKSKFSKSCSRNFAKKAIKRAEQSSEIMKKGLLLTGKVEVPRRRR